MPQIEAIIRAYIARVDDVNPKERSVVAKINTGALDRFRTTIDPKGVDLSNYNANRVVLWEHGMDPTRAPSLSAATAGSARRSGQTGRS